MSHLSEKTRNLAKEALSGVWYRSMISTPVALTEEEDHSDPYLREAYGIRHIAEDAPICIRPDEMLVGSSTLKESTIHVVPVRHPGGEDMIARSISHVTLGFWWALELGGRGLRAKVEDRLARGNLDMGQKNFLYACRITLDALQTWHKRYMDLLDERIAQSSAPEELAHYQQIRKNLANVPENPPTNFREAVQSLLFLFVFTRQCGNWPGIGRIDKMLGKYLEKDLADGTITLDEAREYLAHFWIKGCEWATDGEVFEGSGDAQHYQNIVLSGVDDDGNELVNDVTYLVLDVVEELKISDFPIAVRISKRSPERLLRRIADVQKIGGGIVAIYNNDFIIDNLLRFGYDLKEARNFANDGCWEIQVPGKTAFIYYPFDTLHCLDLALGMGQAQKPDYTDFEDLYRATMTEIRKKTDEIIRESKLWTSQQSHNPLVALLTLDCIERARGYYERGPVYTVLSPHASGLPDVINSLYCFKKIVYDEKKMTFSEMLCHIENNWEGAEEIRQRILHQYETYGNNNPEADALGKRVLADFAAFQYEPIAHADGVMNPAGCSTFGREVSQFLEERRATADGHRKNEILAANLTPTPGSDKNGPTAIILSHCALDLSCLANGTALDIKIHPASVAGEEGTDALVSLYKTFIDRGGIFTHIDIVDNKVLMDAMDHPEKYPNLCVRVSGWSARFTTLSRPWQEMVLKKSMQTNM